MENTLKIYSNLENKMKKINKKSQIESGYIISLLLVLVVIVIILMFIFKLNINKYFNFLPSFKEEHVLTNLSDQEVTEIKKTEFNQDNKCKIIGEIDKNGFINLISENIKNPSKLYLYGEEKQNSEIYIYKSWKDWKIGKIKNGVISIDEKLFDNQEILKYIPDYELKLIDKSQIVEEVFLCKEKKEDEKDVIDNKEKVLSEKDYELAAKDLGIEVALIKAVAEIESSGSGFNSEGKPKILFEGHIFWKRLIANGVSESKLTEISKENKNILYKEWSERGDSYSLNQYDRLENAKELSKELIGNENPAYESASWGKFQILGMNYNEAGFNSVSDFVFAQYLNENEQLKSFINFIKYKKADVDLKNKDWAGFALKYNGKNYKKNNYDTKLKEAYEEYSV